MGEQHRQIDVPEDVIILNPVTGAPVMNEDGTPDIVPFRSFLVRCRAHPCWMETMEAIELGAEVDQAIHTPGNKILLPEGAWQMLVGAVRKPMSVFQSKTHGQRFEVGFGIHPSVVGQLLPFMRAILGASIHNEVATAAA